MISEFTLKTYGAKRIARASNLPPKLNAIIESLRIEWSGTNQRRSHTDCVDAFRGNFFEDSATIEVIATTPAIPASECPPRAARPGFRFVSKKTTLVHFAQIGRERNGVFFA